MSLIELEIGLIGIGIGLVELEIDLIELGRGLKELETGPIELGIGLRISNARCIVLARVSGLVFSSSIFLLSISQFSTQIHLRSLSASFYSYFLPIFPSPLLSIQHRFLLLSLTVFLFWSFVLFSQSLMLTFFDSDIYIFLTSNKIVTCHVARSVRPSVRHKVVFRRFPLLPISPRLRGSVVGLVRERKERKCDPSLIAPKWETLSVAEWLRLMFGHIASPSSPSEGKRNAR